MHGQNMALNQNRAEYVYYSTDKNWLIRIYEEPDDICLQLEHTKEQSFHPIVRFDQSGHKEYHADIWNFETNEMQKYEYFPSVKTREQKICIAFLKIKEYAAQDIIQYCGINIFPLLALENIEKQILNKEIPSGMRRSYLPISVDGIIIDPLNQNNFK